MAEAGETGPFCSCVRPAGDLGFGQQGRCRMEL